MKIMKAITGRGGVSNRFGIKLLIVAVFGLAALAGGVGAGDSSSGVDQTGVTLGTPPLAFTSADLGGISWLSDEDLTNFLAVLAATPTIPYADLATNSSGPQVAGTFYSLQHLGEWPPLPCDSTHSAVWQMSNCFLVDDLGVKYDAIGKSRTKQSSSGTVLEDAVTGPPGFNDTNSISTNVEASDVSFLNFIPYGTNLYLAQVVVQGGYVSGIISNTTADTQYQLEYTTNLQTAWQATNWFVYGSELTNWTAWTVPAINAHALFLRVLNWASVDGTGLPGWWETEYFGTNAVNPYADPSGDGWTVLQDFLNGWSPSASSWETPAAPQGLTVSYNATNVTATLTWQPCSGNVAGYKVEKSDSYYYPTSVQDISIGTNAVFVDNLSTNVQDPAFGDNYDVAYRVCAIYTNRESSAWTAEVPVQQTTVSAVIVPGTNGATYLVLSGVPPNTAYIHLVFIDENAEFYGDSSDDYTTNIPIAWFTNGLYRLPANWIAKSTDAYGDTDYAIYVASIASDGATSAANVFDGGGDWLTGDYNSGVAFYDGRVQMKQDLIFQLRAAPFDGSLQFWYGLPEDATTYIYPTNYAVASFYPSPDYAGQNYGAFDQFSPFEVNYLFRNFVYSITNVNYSGNLTTEVCSGLGPLYCGVSNNPTFLFNSNAPVYQAWLPTNTTTWLFYDRLNADDTLQEEGIVNVSGGDETTITMPAGKYNWFGLRYLSVGVAGESSGSGSKVNDVILAGNNSGSGDFSNPYQIYVQTAQPLFKPVEYDFWEAAYQQNVLSPLPGDPAFSPTNKSQLLVTSVGNNQFVAAGYAKLEVTNTVYTGGVFAYLGQYYASACFLNGNGSLTTNTTGILSPYGNFFPDAPGLVGLVTMADPDTGQTGICPVHVISLNVDANHDGVMDYTYSGPDQTSLGYPFRFWINDDTDWNDFTGTGIPGQGNYADGVVKTEEVAYAGYHWGIHGRRDLIDYFPVYLNIGNLLQSNSLSAGINPNDPSYQFVLSQADGALRFAYTDLTPTNYMNFLLDTNEASKLAYADLTTITTNGVTLPSSFLSSIATNNEGIILVEAWEETTNPLVLSIFQGTNEIAQTEVYLDITGVEQMFRQKNLMLNPNVPALPDRLTVVNEPDTTNKNFVFLHGYNVLPDEARGVAADVYKRMYWSGSHAKFWAVTWEGADTKFEGIFTPNYHTNVYNAFLTAPLLANFIATLTNSGPVVAAAHSLGNMVTLSAISDWNAPISQYFMMDAAVPVEAIDSSATTNMMMFSTWSGYSNRLFASDWYQLFPTNDNRSTLFWNNRLGNLRNVDVYNFYSSGEEVLRTYTSDPPANMLYMPVGPISMQLINRLFLGLPFGTYTWYWQEKGKGTASQDFLLGSSHGGWKFSTYWVNFWGSSLSPAVMNNTTNTILQTQPMFNFPSTANNFLLDVDDELLGSGGSAYAQANRNRILSDAIPAMSLVAGANPVPSFDNNHNKDMQSLFENGWSAERPRLQVGNSAAGEWHHSDFVQMAYTFTYKLFNQFVSTGNLK